MKISCLRWLMCSSFIEKNDIFAVRTSVITYREKNSFIIFLFIFIENKCKKIKKKNLIISVNISFFFYYYFLPFASYFMCFYFNLYVCGKWKSFFFQLFVFVHKNCSFILLDFIIRNFLFYQNFSFRKWGIKLYLE